MFKFLFLSLSIFTIISCTEIKDNKPILLKDNIEKLLQQNKFNLAIEKLNKESDSIKKFNLLAISYSNLKNYKKAELNYQKALAINPKELKTILNYAIFKAKQGNYSKALNMIRKLQKTGANIEVNITLAQLYILLNSKDRAIEVTKKIEKNDLTLKQIEKLISLYRYINANGLIAEMYEYYVSKAIEEGVNINIAQIKQIINRLRI